MTNHIITGKQMQSIIVMFWLGSLIVLGANKEAKQDFWISILLATVMFLPFMWLYIRLISLYPGMNLFEILFQIFGKVFGRIMSLLFVVFAIHLGGQLVRIFSEFISIVNMPETPEALTASVLMLFVVWSVKNGPENIGRVSKYTWVMLGIFIPFTFIVGMKDMKFSNLMPIMNTDFKSLLGSSYSFLTLPLGQAILCLSFFSAVDKTVKPWKIFIKALIISITITLVVVLRNIFILGPSVVSLFYFPSYEAVSIMTSGEFFSRFEVLIGINLMLAGFIKTCVCLYSASLGLAKVLNVTDQKTLAVPCALLFVTLSGLLYKNTQEWVGWIKYYQFYSIPFQIILPVITLIGAEIQTRIKSAASGGQKKTES